MVDSISFKQLKISTFITSIWCVLQVGMHVSTVFWCSSKDIKELLSYVVCFIVLYKIEIWKVKERKIIMHYNVNFEHYELCTFFMQNLVRVKAR